MIDIEKHEKLRAAIHSNEVEISELENELKINQIQQKELDEEALKAEILEERGWKKKKELALEKGENIDALKREIEKCRKAIMILKENEEKIQKETLKEIKSQYHPIFEAALKNLYLKLIEAEEMEREISALREKVITDAMKFGIYTVGLEPLGSFDPITIERSGEPKYQSPISRFVKRCKMNGFNIE